MSPSIPVIHAPRGPHRSAKGWIQEAAKRMLMNNLDPAVAENPAELIVYGGRGKAARSWHDYHTLVATLERLENDATFYLDTWTDDLEDALRQAEAAKRAGKALSIGLLGNAADIVPAMLRRDFIPDLVTDQTSAHDPLMGYIPPGASPQTTPQHDPAGYKAQVLEAMAGHCHAIVDMHKRGAIAFDYGNNLRAMAKLGGCADAFAYPGFVPAFIRDQFCTGRGPFRWVALSGNPEDIYKTDRALLELFPDDAGLRRWLTEGVTTLKFPGLPARICWLGYGERDKAGLLFNDMVRRGVVEAPIVLGRDHLDAGYDQAIAVAKTHGLDLPSLA